MHLVKFIEIKPITLTLLLFSITSYSKTVDFSQIEYKNKIIYEKNNTKAFTGTVVKKYKNGQKKDKSQYLNGKLNGKKTIWNKKGQKIGECHYINNKINGKCTAWFENVELVNNKLIKEYETNYKDNKFHGKHTEWYKNGKKRLEYNYLKGQNHGKSTEWYEDGKKKSEVNYINGEIK